MTNRTCKRHGWIVQFNVDEPSITPCGHVVPPGWRDLGHMIIDGCRVFPAVHSLEKARRIAREFHEANPHAQTRIREK